MGLSMCGAEKEKYDNVYEYLDSPPVRTRIFALRKTSHVTFPGATDFEIPVDGDVFVAARYFRFHRDFPTIIHFHGSGEIISDYDEIAGEFERAKTNLFLAEFRGYAWSSGSPSARYVKQDALKIADFVIKTIPKNQTNTTMYLMGRSLGSIPATIIAGQYPDHFAGLILDSAFADVVPVMERLGIAVPGRFRFEITSILSNHERLQKVMIPVLILHGDEDRLVPIRHASINFDAIPHAEKKFVILKGARHNNTMMHPDYFKSIYEMIQEKGGKK